MTHLLQQGHFSSSFYHWGIPACAAYGAMLIQTTAGGELVTPRDKPPNYPIPSDHSEITHIQATLNKFSRLCLYIYEFRYIHSSNNWRKRA